MNTTLQDDAQYKPACDRFILGSKNTPLFYNLRSISFHILRGDDFAMIM
ncbi:MAG: hypothetical protein AAF378_22805 [Cyanobacteria bacterium P01_A01_bin.84]